ncbi:MAG: TonB-dependent receptor [Candidatus Scalindua sp. AMX11]|nr:MAG: TonB-dependent receptor [Candidatus Scalindua sp.]NOG85075.1 TonB-dependent receptor [Planctomycetota bacterium]RZV93122.1 MAG: TonB-dependent receptor [Candidatus Scalindua sp. SCAELEC01]TDE66747.1 MAG: TonB-dependent receptor [Candidatus Scalindua sp. AMX11]GJQ58059.1 MAG: ferric enterobactin receptor [Candidatus Scalindua sp.]
MPSKAKEEEKICTLFKSSHKLNFLLFLLLLSFTPDSSYAQTPEEGFDDLFAIFSEEEVVISALKRPQTVLKSPAIMSVVTAKQIKQMGFRSLADVLRTVPGFDISMDRTGEKEISARGLLTINSEKVKIMIDGHSINDALSGGASNNFSDLVVENAKRIEIIRGPGSALHGQNAFLAVVNVITKDTKDIDGFQWTLSGGSFDTQKYNMMFGKEIGDLKISGFFDYFDTEGFSEQVDQDFLFPAPFSNSPGRTQNSKEKTDLNLKLSYKNLEFKGKYMKKRREGYIGIGDSLNDETELKDTYLFGELLYKFKLGEKLAILPRVYYDQYNFDPHYEQLPEGFTVSPPMAPLSIVFPDGWVGDLSLKERTIGFENQINYKVFERNELTFGFQYEWIHQGDVKSSFNFNPVPPILPMPSDLPFTRRVTRQIWSFYLQDEWNITDDIDLTVGIRHDRFTRFGSTTNPRIGFIWRFLEDDAHLKILFATAFRAPNFNELFLTNNNVVIGDPSLDPEKVNTFELGLGYNFSKHVRGNLNYFYNRIRDRIVATGEEKPQQFANSGGVRIKGVEVELKAEFGNNSYAYANYTFQDTEETRSRNRIPNIPMHKANFGVNVELWKYVNANLHTFITGPRPREHGDTREDLPSHTIVNMTFIGQHFLDNFEIRGHVNNLFDKGYDDPSPINTVPTDYPQPKRSFYVELRYSF